MQRLLSGSLKNVAVSATLLVLLVASFTFVGIVRPWKARAASTALPPQPAGPLPGVELVGNQTVSVPEDVQKSVGIRNGPTEMVAVAELPSQTQTLVLPGATALDPTRLYRIRARFAPARVIELAPVVDDVASRKAGEPKYRELRAGDKVKKGDLLGVFYSIDVGNKKSDLTDAISQRYMDEEILDEAVKAFRKGSVPEVFMLNAQRNVEADRGLETRAVHNLRIWDIPEAEIKACYDEALKLRKLHGKERDLARVEKNKEWARVELQAPEDGIVVERNICRDEMIVDGTVNVFQIAKMERLLVLANAPEDSLPILNNVMKTTERKWTVGTVGADAKTGIPGIIDEVGYLIDPNQHTAIVKGYIDNKNGLLRAGQFISATVPIPPPKDVVAVPASAVAEDGQLVVVFVQEDPAKPHFTMRRVQVTNRFPDKVFIRSKAFEKGEALTPADEEAGLLPKEPVRVGERVLTSAVDDLMKFVLEKRSEKKDVASR
jgi:membrane fusion protein, heavy metal efflux system